MPRGAEQLLERMKNSPYGWGEKEMKTVLTGYGFKNRKGGKHTVYQHKAHPELIISVPRSRDLKPWVARDVVKLIESIAYAEKERSRS